MNKLSANNIAYSVLDLTTVSEGQSAADSFHNSRRLATIQKSMKLFLEKTKVNEVMATAHIYDQEARLHSYEIFAAVMQNR